MQERTRIGNTLFLVTAVVLVVTALVVTGCSAGSLANGTGSTINTATTSVPVSITDAPGDQVLAATLTLNSVVLTNENGVTASVLTAPLTFEAAHLDAVQEPLFTPAVSEDTYKSVTLTYSNAQVVYVDPTSKQVVVANVTPVTSTQTITFSTPIKISNASSSLLVDYLVEKSVNISGSTVTVTPTFNVTAAPTAAQPTNGTNGLQCGVEGRVSVLGTNQFTLVNPAGISMTVTVNNNTQYQGPTLTSFAQLAVNMLVEVDLELQTSGTMLAVRVEEQMPPPAANATAALLVGPVTAVTGSPATSFKEVVRQQIGPAPSATPVQTVTITVDSSTKFQLPGRWQNIVVGGVPFTPTFSASTLFAGQVVAVATSGVTGNAATAQTVILAPQTVGGTIAQALPPICSSCWAQITLTLPSDSWLANLTGKSTVTVLVPPGGLMQMLVPSTAAAVVSSAARFNGFLFNNNGTLTLVALVEGPGPGTAIGPTP